MPDYQTTAGIMASLKKFETELIAGVNTMEQAMILKITAEERERAINDVSREEATLDRLVVSDLNAPEVIRMTELIMELETITSPPSDDKYALKFAKKYSLPIETVLAIIKGINGVHMISHIEAQRQEAMNIIVRSAAKV